MSKKIGCLVLIVVAFSAFFGLAWSVWVGKQEVIASFTDDPSGLENPFMDLPTIGPIALDLLTIRWSRRLAGRIDPVAFEGWAKERSPHGEMSWTADSAGSYRDLFRDESLLKEAGLPATPYDIGDRIVRFVKEGRLIHILEVNTTKNTFFYHAYVLDEEDQDEQ